MLKNKFPERIPDEEEEKIKKDFHNRCGRCHEAKPLSVHEIVPRGAIGEAAMKRENRIALCGECHEWAHRIGTANSVSILQGCRLKVLQNVQKEKPVRRVRKS
jgi:5-methylcytosine-specific restriction endonuclease McrA